MADNPPLKLKLKLKKTETSRLKTETGRQKTEEVDSFSKPTMEMPGVQTPPPPAAPQVEDPMSRRDSSAGKLRKVQIAPPGAPAGGSMDTSIGPGVPKATETVRLKIVREKKPKLGADAGTGPPDRTTAVPPPSDNAPSIAAPAVPAAEIPADSHTPTLKVKTARAGSDTMTAPHREQLVSRAQARKPAEGQEPGGTVRVQPPAGAPVPGETDTSTLPVPPPAAKRSGSDTMTAPHRDELVTKARSEQLAEAQAAATTIQTGPPPGGVKLKAPGIDVPGRTAVMPAPAPKNETATLKVRPEKTTAPGAGPAAGAENEGLTVKDSRKQATATLKVRPKLAGKAAPAAPAPPAATSSGIEAAAVTKNATATLKIRPSRLTAPKVSSGSEAGSTIKIKPPTPKQQPPTLAVLDDQPAETKIAAPLPDEQATAATKPKLSLKSKAKKAADEPRGLSVPGVGLDDDDSASATVALPPPSDEDDSAQATVAVEPPAEGAAPADKKKKKKGLKLRSRKSREGDAGAEDEAQAETAPEEGLEEAAEAEMARPAGVRDGPGLVVVAGSMVATAAAAALTVRLVLDFLAYIK